jgi:hypothetical protein
VSDASAALSKVQRFIVILERGQKEWPSDSTAPFIKTWRSNEILEMLPLIVRIAARVDTDLAANLQEESDGWPYQQTLKAARQLVGLLKSAKDVQQILGQLAPELSAANLHPWIWDAAADLWDAGHRREAVQAAAQALFDHYLPARCCLVKFLASACRLYMLVPSPTPAAFY